MEIFSKSYKEPNDVHTAVFDFVPQSVELGKGCLTRNLGIRIIIVCTNVKLKIDHSQNYWKLSLPNMRLNSLIISNKFYGL